MGQGFRLLNEDEIIQLQTQGCSCDDWSRVEVSQTIKLERLRNSDFSGDVRIGSQESQVSLEGGLKRLAGIYNASIHNCTIGENVYISGIDNYIANYDIGDNVIISNVSLMVVDGKSSFGNGEKLCVINESGGRDIPICDKLSSHAAYMLALYRDNEKLTKRLNSFVDDYVETITSDRGTIGDGVTITNCGVIKNVRIADAAVLEQVSSLKNGSINSCPQDPTYVGADVIAKDFILLSGARVSENSILTRCFVGQASELSKQFSAENSAFFANCGGYHGEACSIFAGPYTVTHHKSTLLIAGMYSFLNAGSGSNQSNHMYKLGPLHQGIIERGSKTTSDSYILWPARVGAFTLIMGRHYNNSDTSDLPFSYLIENNNESHLAPGVNIRSVGTLRDARKWPKRDKRKSPVILDHIIFNLLTPYTVQKMLKGREILKNLKLQQGDSVDYYDYNGVRIKRSALKKGLDFYSMGIDRYLGNVIVDRLRRDNCKSIESMRNILKLSSDIGKGKWLDISGLLAPSEVIDTVISDVVSGKLNSLGDLNGRFSSICANFLDYELCWVKNILENRCGKKFECFEAQDFIALISNWIVAVERLDNLRIEDASKEFTKQAQVGFGVDGDRLASQRDFANTRGSLEDNDFIIELKTRLAGKKKTAAKLIEMLESF